MRRIAPVVLLLAITILFYWKLTLTNQYTWLDGPDYVYQMMPGLQEQARQWHHGTFPTWDPHSWAGMPLVGQVQPGVVNPFVWTLFAMPRIRGSITVAGLHWQFILIHFFGALFCYWLCRDVALSRLASILGGCAYAFGGFMGMNGWPQLVTTAVWIPLSLLFVLRVFRRRRPLSSAALAGVALGLSMSAGHHNVPALALVTLGGLWMYYLASSWRRRKWTAFGPPAAFFACAALVSAAQAAPAWEFGKLALRWVGLPTPLAWDQTVPYSVHETYSLSPAGLLGIVIPGLTWATSGYMGIVAVTLALIAVSALWRKRTVRILAFITLAGIALALGGNSLIYGVLYAVAPLMEKARSPHMASAIFALGIAGLAAFGLDWVRTRKVSRVAPGILLAIAAFLFAVVLVGQTVHPQAAEAYNYSGMAALAAAVLAGALLSTGRTAVLMMLLLMLVELSLVATRFGRRDGDTIRHLGQHDDIADFLKAQPGPPRAEVDADQIPYNFGDWYGINTVDGYGASAIKALADVQGSARVRMMLGVSHSIGAKPNRADQQQVFQGRSGLFVYKNPTALPRARTVHETHRVSDLRLAVDDPAYDLSRTALVEEDISGLTSCESPDRVSVRQYRPTSVTLDAEMACRGMVILGDSWFPGWSASVDGNAARLIRVNGLVRGVVVDAGKHQVVMKYTPWSLYAGASLSVLGFALCGFLHLAERRKWV